MPLDSTSNPVAEILIGVIDILETYGWCQNSAMNGTGMCLWGAIRKITGAEPESKPLLDMVLQRIVDKNDIKIVEIPAWNDEPGRTKEQVIEVLKNSLF